MLQKYHDQVFVMLNSRLSETFRFYAPLLTALAGLGFVWLESTRVAGTSNNKLKELLEAAYFVSIFLSFGGIIYVLATSYTYRGLQIVLARLEEELGLMEFSPGWDPRKKLCRKSSSIWKRAWWLASFWMVPELLKVHLLMLMSALLLISIGYFTYGGGSIPITVCLVASLLIVVYVLQWHYLRKLRNSCKEAEKKKVADTIPAEA